MAKPVTRTITRGGTTYTMDTAAIGGNSKSSAVPPAPAAQLKVGGAETERDGVGDVIDPGEADDDAKLAARPVETEYNSRTQGLLKHSLSRNDLPSMIRYPARQVAAAARTFALKTLAKTRKRMERQRQWLTDFLAALDDSTER